MKCDVCECEVNYYRGVYGYNRHLNSMRHVNSLKLNNLMKVVDKYCQGDTAQKVMRNREIMTEGFNKVIKKI